MTVKLTAPYLYKMGSFCTRLWRNGSAALARCRNASGGSRIPPKPSRLVLGAVFSQSLGVFAGQRRASSTQCLAGPVCLHWPVIHLDY
jgi:hypothetical protein